MNHNQTFVLADSDNKKHAAMFPDSKIAQSYKQNTSNVKYVIAHRITDH